MTLLHAQEIDYSYPGRSRVLADVEVHVDAGEAVAIIGSSGAGKSTLLRILAGLTIPEGGHVLLDGTDLTHRTTRKAGAIGYVHQQHGLPLGITVEMAVLGGQMHAWSLWKILASPVLGPTPSERERVQEVLTRVGLAGLGAERVAELSIGQRQRVAVARTLLQEPRIVVADEPVASVDPTTAKQILGLLVAEADRGAGVVCSVHDVGMARRHFSRIVALADGRVMFDGPSRDLDDLTVADIYNKEAE